MARLNATLFREYFGGSWSGRITNNGEFQREIVFNWPSIFGIFSAIGSEEGKVVPPSLGALDNTKQISIAGWQNGIRRWKQDWYNEFGGYGKLEWTSQEIINGQTVLYGYGYECKQESDDLTDHILKCEIFDQDHFKYSIQSFRKGLTEIDVHRYRTAKELNDLLEKQARSAIKLDLEKIL